ncbi:MAG TPA: SRPBCC domain-containing protein [Nocardioidaceae bacterium]|nr:SRPBCC domain-containing protein [Nocardioidaceae bacterium]
MTSKARDGDRIIGSLRTAEGKGVVRMEDRFDTEVDDLWSALTDPGRLARWLGEVEGDLRPGGEFRARFFDGWAGTGRVDTCEPPQRLLLSMRDADAQPGQPGDGAIEVTLAADGEQTVLVWEERGMPLNLLAAYGAGVQVHVEDLAAHIAGRERGDAAARWEELLPAYRDLAAKVS